MEVDQSQYRKQLLPILQNIAGAAFISFDLEMSGIFSRGGVGDRSHDVGKPDLQRQYEEVKAAAETFQVLQVGITCVEEDREKEMYIARPYNFNLSPLFIHGDRLEIDRRFTFSSSACDFLQRNSFDFGKVFSSGIPYLSQEEEARARTQFNHRAEQTLKIPDVVIPLNDPEALDFYRLSRKKISDWANDATKPKADFVNIGNPAGPLNGYQRRLIYQLVRSEFPGYRAFARNEQSFMQIEKLDHKKEAQFQKRKLEGFNSMVARQTGLRWIFEALTGGNLDGIDPAWFSSELDENKAQRNLKSLEVELSEVKKALKAKKPVIVGHNLFMDLAFMYNTFIGPLPPRIKYFEEEIHHLFPFIVDTKYLATHGADSMNPRANLKELLAQFKKVHIPLIVLHEQHTAYGSSFGRDHEAGFDSWMTAELFVKLVAKLHHNRREIEEDISGSRDYEVSDSESDDGQNYDGHSGGGVLLSPMHIREPSLMDDLPLGWNASRNPFSVLATQLADKETVDPASGQWIPSMKSDFWKVYGNKLRVNASQAEVIHLGKEI